MTDARHVVGRTFGRDPLCASRDPERRSCFVTQTGGKPAFSDGIATQAHGEPLAHRGETQAARERLEQALGVFRRMHALPYIEQLEQALLDLGQSG